MTRDESVALFLQGCEAWHAWAAKMRAERKALEEAGQWVAERNSDGDLKPRNSKTTEWVAAAEANFSGCQFILRGTDNEGSDEAKESSIITRSETRVVILESNVIDFSCFVFPHSAQFEAAQFLGRTAFNDACFHGKASFNDAKFHGKTNFSLSQFLREVRFDKAKFLEEADFPQTEFSKRTWFNGANFECKATFIDTQFQERIMFEGVTFGEECQFFRTNFRGKVSFDHSTFHGEAGFGNSSFQNDCSFIGAKFGTNDNPENTNFKGIKAERIFDLTRAFFSRVPSFNQADFKQAPDLDAVKFPLPSFWKEGDERLVPQYRAIRRIAIQGADYEREQIALKGEIRSKRYAEHNWRHAAFWYGFAYDALSDFGRSMSRPSLILAISIVGFALLYLVSSDKLVNAFADCAAATAPNYESALIISWKNALPFISMDSKAEEVARMCLYGANAFGGIAIQGFQKVWSTVLVFLFLLAVRNQFKIK